MDELPSTEFRKRFARLTKPTLVTVNGHFIGAWTPVPATVTGEIEVIVREKPLQDVSGLTPEALEQRLRRFNSRPFTPVPKKGK